MNIRYNRSSAAFHYHINQNCFQKSCCLLPPLLQFLFIAAIIPVCAGHPWKVMGIGLMVAASLCVGIMSLQITTDPVDLWASPNSRSRLEKNYYDENFEPFYRTAQIFIRPIGIESVSILLLLFLAFDCFIS